MLDFGFYNDDCMNGMKEFPDKYFDLAICDPPYGINANHFNNGNGLKDHSKKLSTSKRVEKGRLNQEAGKLKNRSLNSMNCEWDSKPPDELYFQELFRVSKNQIIWGGNYFNLPSTRCIVIWDKMQPWENFSQVEMAWTSFDYPAALFKYRSTNEKNKIHPTQKPLALYEWLLSKYAKDGDLILDTHVGSASSLIACRNAGYKYVGFEIDEYYYSLAKKRLEEAQSQLNIFDFMDEYGKKRAT